MESIDPESLTPAASLNRVRLVELPGVEVEPEVLGRTGYGLLSARALADCVRLHADQLGLADVTDAEPSALLPRFDRCLVDSDAAVRDAAETIARQCGRRLGYLILTIRRGNRANRRARPDWDDSYWAHWAAVKSIHVAGGVVSGNLGPRIVEHAARTVAETGMTDCRLDLASWPALLPLIGAARTAGQESAAALVFDFGHSFVKRGVGWYHNGALTGLDMLPSRPAEETALPGGVELTPEHSRRLGDFMTTVLADTWQAVRARGIAAAPTLAVSVASYVRDGQPLPRQGGLYAALLSLSDDLSRWLAGRVSDRVRYPLDVTLLHDGTAAARAYAGTAHAAVITLGTALGVGFPPPAEGLHPIAPAFAVRESDLSGE